MELSFPYGKETHTIDLPYSRLNGVLVSKLQNYKIKKSQVELVEEALSNPIGSSPLSELAISKKKVVLVASDHTRPVPSKVMLPPMLREIRRGNPDADITILIATGCHRRMNREEMIYKFGEDIVNNENSCSRLR